MAVFNNGLPTGYQQYYPQYYPQFQNQQMSANGSTSNGMIWVHGLAGANSFLCGPNVTVPLWDSEAPVIYLKSTDTSGMPSMKILDYSIRESQQNPIASASNNGESNYATKDDIKDIREQLEAISGRINAISARKDRKEYTKNE